MVTPLVLYETQDRSIKNKWVCTHYSSVASDLIRIVFNINAVNDQTGPIHESDNHIFAKIPGGWGGEERFPLDLSMVLTYYVYCMRPFL